VELTESKMLTFDCYSTLIDWDSGLFSALMPLVRKGRVTEARAQLLQIFAKHEAAQEEQTPAIPYSQLLSVVYKRLAMELGVAVTDDEANARLLSRSHSLATSVPLQTLHWRRSAQHAVNNAGTK